MSKIKEMVQMEEVRAKAAEFMGWVAKKEQRIDNKGKKSKRIWYVDSDDTDMYLQSDYRPDCNIQQADELLEAITIHACVFMMDSYWLRSTRLWNISIYTRLKGDKSVFSATSSKWPTALTCAIADLQEQLERKEK